MFRRRMEGTNRRELNLHYLGARLDCKDLSKFLKMKFNLFRLLMNNKYAHEIN